MNNPAKSIPNIKTEPRQQVWSMQDEAQFLKHAGDDMMKLAFLLGAYTAQRQADILKMTWDDYDEDNNRIIVRQNKTGANVSIPVHAKLEKALKKAPRNGDTILTTQEGGQFGPDYFRHRWLKATKNAKIDGLRFQDLRRTAIVRMGEAGSTVPEIAAVSGHTISSAHQILKTYLPTNENMAASAIRKWEKAEENEG